MYPLTKPVLNLMSSQNWKPQQNLYLSLCLFYLAGWTWCTKGIWSLISLMKLRNWSCKDCKIFIRITHIRRLCCACVSNWQLHAYTAVEMFRNNSCSLFLPLFFLVCGNYWKIFHIISVSVNQEAINLMDV